MRGPQATNRVAAGRIDLRRAATRENTRVRVTADHRHPLQAGCERQDAIVLQENDAFFGVRARDLGVLREVDGRGCHGGVDGAELEQRARDAPHHVVEACLWHLTVLDRGSELIQPLIVASCAHSGFLIQAGVRVFHRVVLRAPVGHHLAAKAPITLQYARQ